MGTTVADYGRPVAPAKKWPLEAPRSKRVTHAALAFKMLATAGLLAVVTKFFSDLDTGAAWERIAQSGWALALLMVPALSALASDTGGLAACVRAPFTGRLCIKILPARFGCDSLCSALPGGVAMAEPVRSLLLSQALRAPVSEGVAAMLTAKVNMAAAQALFLGGVAIVFLLNDRLLRSLPILNAAALPAAMLIGVLCVLILLFYAGWCPAFLENRARSVREVRMHVRQFSRENARKLVASIGLFLTGWVFAGLEAYAILTILGADATMADGLLLEGTASLLRIAFFFLPSAVGAAEVGYATLIAALGVGDPLTVSAAFIVLKRSRELLWIIGGLLTLLAVRWNDRADTLDFEESIRI